MNKISIFDFFKKKKKKKVNGIADAFEEKIKKTIEGPTPAEKKKYKKWKKEAKKEFKNEVKKEGILKPILKFFIPFGVAAITILSVYLLFYEIFYDTMRMVGVFLFSPISSELAISYAVKKGLDVYFIFYILFITDTLTCLFVVWNFDYVKIIPLVRRFAKNAEDKGKELRKKYKWIKSVEFFGVTFFVLVPLWGTGSFIASLVGKLINMNDWRIFIAVVIGSILRISLAIAVVTGVFGSIL